MACLFAATYPERTRALLIWGGQARWVQTGDYPWGQTPEEKQQEITELQENGVTWEYVFGVGGGHVSDPDYAEWFLRWVRAGASPAALADLERMNAEIDVRDILPAIRVPTLVMNRIGDPAAHVDAARDLASRIPGARFVELAGDTHSMFLVEPEKVLATIEEFLIGAPSRRRDDRVLATIVYLDIVGSTARLAEVGDAAWNSLLAQQSTVAAQQIAAYGGRLIDQSGDSILATFDGPARAIRCADTLQQRSTQLGVHLRAGIHTGEVERTAGVIRGIAVHTAARIAAVAQADQVLVSSTVRDLVAGSGLVFKDRGLHDLKGVPEPRRLYLVSSSTS